MTSITRAGAPQGDQQQLESWKVGTALAGAAGLVSFQPSLLPRSKPQQGLITLAAMGLAYGVGAGTNALGNKVDETTDLDAVESRFAVAGAGGLAVLGTMFALRGRPAALVTSVPHLSLEGARMAGGVVAGGSVLGAAMIGEQALVDRISDDVPGGAAAAHAAILGSAAIGIGALVFGRPRASGVTAEAERAYMAATGTQGSSTNLATFDAAHFDELVRLRSEMTTVPGLRPGSRLPDGAANSDQVIKYLNEATPGKDIARVMGIDAAAAKDPIRVYGGVHHAGTADELAQKIFDEALEAGSFDRGHVMLYLPSGTGHVNPTAVASAEYLTNGDVASIAMQYGTKPSVQSVGKREDAAELFHKVLTKFGDHIATLPEGQRPKLLAYGESLGAWGIQDSFLVRGGLDGIADSGLDAIVSVGTPRFSGLRSQALGPAGHSMDETGRMFEFNALDELQALPPEQRDGIRAFLLSHHNDPVNKFSPRMFFARPEWLAQAEYGTGIPRKMKWYPVVSGLQGMVDNMNSVKVVPGILEKTGHDYRAEMAPFINEVLRSGANDTQLSGINTALNQLELARVHAPAPAIRNAVTG